MLYAFIKEKVFSGFLSLLISLANGIINFSVKFHKKEARDNLSLAVDFQDGSRKHSTGKHSVRGSRNTKLRVLKLDKINIFKMANKKLFCKDNLSLYAASCPNTKIIQVLVTA